MMTSTIRLRHVLVCGFVLLATVATTATDVRVRSWNVPADILGSRNQLSFNQGARGVWFFMESQSTVHDPLTYRLLPTYSVPCDNFPPVIGFACWQSASLSPVGDQHIPFVSTNFARDAAPILGQAWPGRTLFLNPSPDRLAIVAWKSPVSGTVRVAGSFTQFNGTCGNGIVWSVDKGSATLAMGQIGSGGGTQTFDLSHVRIEEDQALYFTADSLSDLYCDEAPLTVTITTAGSRRDDRDGR